MVFHLQLLQFMDYNTAVKFYKKLKEYIQKDKVEENEDYNLYESFFVYFEKTWLNFSGKNNSFFNFDLWSYYKKFEFNCPRNKLIDSDSFMECVAFSNNAVESTNHLINTFIKYNTAIKYEKFKDLVLLLFLRMESRRKIYRNIKDNFVIKNQLSDLMITLVNKGIGNSLKILSLKEIKDLKVNFNEEEILSFINDINEEEESEKDLDEEDSYEDKKNDYIDIDNDN